MNSVVIVLLALLAAPQSDAVGKVESSYDKKVNFSGFRTYAWLSGYNAYNPAAHKLIIEAFEAEMAGLGFTKVSTGADVTLAYYTVTGTDVDLKALDNAGSNGATPTKSRGRLVAIMRVAADKQIWSASTREYIDPDPAKLGGMIQSVTARLFATYPGKAAGKIP